MTYRFSDYSILSFQNRDLPLIEHTVLGSSLDEVLKEERGRLFARHTYFGATEYVEWYELGKVGDVHNITLIPFPDVLDRERLN
uniref:hypothetical protein n=1 Tax=Marinobacterium profundum TaxID=1714300 RepID=UPI000A46410E|nr:hypothetical protein [Marinobacterium profundum]